MNTIEKATLALCRLRSAEWHCRNVARSRMRCLDALIDLGPTNELPSAVRSVRLALANGGAPETLDLDDAIRDVSDLLSASDPDGRPMGEMACDDGDDDGPRSSDDAAMVWVRPLVDIGGRPFSATA